LSFRDPQTRLRDIEESIIAIEEFVQGMNFGAFIRDVRTQAAVERKLLLIGEAARKLGDDAETLCPGLPWRDIRGIGDWLRHQYERASSELVWNTVMHDLPQLKAAVEKALYRTFR